MNRAIRNLIGGMGSILVIMPPPARPHIGDGILGRSDVDALRGDWLNVGRYLQGAMVGEPAIVDGTPVDSARVTE